MIYLSIWFSSGLLSFFIMSLEDNFYEDLTESMPMAPPATAITVCAILASLAGGALFVWIAAINTFLAFDYIKTSIRAAICRYKMAKSSHGKLLSLQRKLILAEWEARGEELSQYDLNIIDIAVHTTLKNFELLEEKLQEQDAKIIEARFSIDPDSNE